MSPDDALAIMEKDRGTAFDPECWMRFGIGPEEVRADLRLLRKVKEIPVGLVGIEPTTKRL